jgi:hypothetical protein
MDAAKMVVDLTESHVIAATVARFATSVAFEQYFVGMSYPPPTADGSSAGGGPPATSRTARDTPPGDSFVCGDSANTFDRSRRRGRGGGGAAAAAAAARHDIACIAMVDNFMDFLDMKEMREREMRRKKSWSLDYRASKIIFSKGRC